MLDMIAEVKDINHEVLKATFFGRGYVLAVIFIGIRKGEQLLKFTKELPQINEFQFGG